MRRWTLPGPVPVALVAAGASPAPLPRSFTLTWTIVYAIVCVILLGFSVGLLFFRSLRSRFRSAAWLCLVGIGACCLLSVDAWDAWSWPGHSIPFKSCLYHVCGFGLLHWPLILRAWRIVSLHSATPNFLPPSGPSVEGCCRRDDRMLRGTKWLVVRLLLMLVVPFVIYVGMGVAAWICPPPGAEGPPTCSSYFALHSLFSDIFTIWDLVTVLCLVVVSIWMFVLRRKGSIVFADMDESRTLLVVSLLLVLYVAEDELFWYVFLDQWAEWSDVLWTTFLTLALVFLVAVVCITVVRAFVDLAFASKRDRLASSQLASMLGTLGGDGLDPEIPAGLDDADVHARSSYSVVGINR